ncbi:hypothetical protein GN958_ATG10672, partial [Phytophthora infestans]
LFQGKLKIKADRVDELDAGYACSNVTALRFPKAMGKLVGAASTARQSGSGRSFGCQGGKRKRFQGKFQIKADRVDELDAGSISEGYGEARGCGVDCKADSSWPQRRLPRRKARERDKRCQGKFQIKADRVEDLDSGYACRNVTALRFPTAMVKLVAAASTARQSGCGRSVGCQGGKAPISEGYGEARGCGVDCKADSSWPQRRLPRHKARERDKLFQGKFQIKADRVEDLDSGYAGSNVTALRFPKAMGKLVGAASTARQSGCGRSVGCQGGKRKRFQGKLQIKADRVDELDAGYACSNVTALRFPTAMGKLVSAASTARQSGCGRSVGCQGGKARERDKLFQGKLHIKADRVDELDAGYACSNVTALRFPKAMGKLVGAASTARQSGCGRSVGCQGGKRVSATSVVAGTISYGYGEARERGVGCKPVRLWAQRRLPRRKTRERDKRCQGKFQIKADRVDELDAGYACSDVTALRFPTAMGKLGKFQIKADRVDELDAGYACSDVTALRFPTAMGKLGKFQIKADRVEDLDAGYSCSDVTALRFPKAMGELKRFQGKLQIKADRVDELDAGYACSNVTALRFPKAMGKLRFPTAMGEAPISEGYGEARERGVDCKTDSSWAQRRLPRRKARERDVVGCRCDFRRLWGSSWVRRRLQGCQVVGAAAAAKAESADFLRLWGSSWLRRRLQGSQVVGAASAAKAEKRKLFQGKLQIKADRVDELDAGYACSNVTALRFPKAMGKLVGAASTARRTARGRSVGCQGGKRKRFQGKFQIKADRVDELDAGSISEGYGEARGCGVDCKADSSWPQRRLPRRKAPISYGYEEARGGVDCKA